MAFYSLLMLAIVAVSTSHAEFDFSQSISCAASGSANTCKISGLTSNDIWNVKLTLSSGTGCEEENYRLKIDGDDMLIRVDGSCNGVFKLESTVPQFPPYQPGVCGVNNQPPKSSFRIIGGGPASPCQYPWMAEVNVIWSTHRTFCGASIIDEKHILTAAHCVHPKPLGTKVMGEAPASILKVKTGSADSYDRFIKRDVEKVFVHKDYETFNLNNDIAILRLKEAIKFDSCHSAVCLTDDMTVTSGRTCKVMGWGKAHSTEGRYNRLMKVADDELMSQSLCKSKFAPWTEQVMCGSTPVFCSGDGGDPLTCLGTDKHWYQLGIVHTSQVAERYCNNAGTYTLVPFFKKWIEEQVKKA